jgi:hypothetical protein
MFSKIRAKSELLFRIVITAASGLQEPGHRRQLTTKW